MEYDNSNTNGNTPDKKNVNKNKLNLMTGFKDGNIIADNLNPQLNSISKENTKMEEKKIVNNKPSQFRPIIGVNFHNVKR